MPYDDDDDLFGEEFDFVDDDDDDAKDDEKAKEEPAPKKKRPVSRDRDKADKPPARGPKRARPSSPVNKREPRREPNKAGDGIAGPRSSDPIAGPPGPPPKPPLERAPVGYIIDDVPLDDEPSEVEPEPAPAPVPTGPPSDHLVHIYEYGNFKRTIARKFTDEEAVGFAEEYTRTGKAYGRYAIATPDDEEPAPTFAGAAKG